VASEDVLLQVHMYLFILVCICICTFTCIYSYITRRRTLAREEVVVRALTSSRCSCTYE